MNKINCGLVLVCLICVFSCFSLPEEFPDPPSGITYLDEHWKDNFDAYNPELWEKVDNYSWENNASVMKNYNVEYVSGSVCISFLKNDGPFSTNYGTRYHSCAQLYTRAFIHSDHYDYKYGKYSVRMKAATGSGIVSSFFLFRWAPWQEIDIEFLGKNTTKFHINVYYNSGTGTAPLEDPEVIDLGFDAAADYHTYAIEWERDHITWYVDGSAVGTRKSPQKNIPDQPMYLAMNIWNCNSTSWSGPLFADEPGKRTAFYDWVEYFPSRSY
ncbi:MAG: family 16 glycosylhydrolase [Spirochaetales bacterium]|nr:family 16 glycosylhydrolase [Spirochaetales bacterium]